LDNNFIRTQLYEFGSHIHTVAIAFVLSFIAPISPIVGIIALIFIFIALSDIKRLNIQLTNLNLEAFRTKYLRSFIFNILAIMLLIVGGVSLALVFIFPLPGFDYFGYGLAIAIILMVIGFIFLISASVMKMRAWENLKQFFQQNKDLVPDALRHEILDGCDNLRTGALLYALGFLGITIIIGFIFKIVGYFKLAKLNTIIYQSQPKEVSSQYRVQYQSEQSQSAQLNLLEEQIPEKSVETINYCAYCGAKLNRGGHFCPLCGSKIN